MARRRETTSHPAEAASSRLRLFSLFGIVVFFAVVIALSLTTFPIENSGFVVRGAAQSSGVAPPPAPSPISAVAAVPTSGGSSSLTTGPADWRIPQATSEQGMEVTTTMAMGNSGNHVLSAYKDSSSQTANVYIRMISTLDGSIVWSQMVNRATYGNPVKVSAARDADAFYVLAWKKYGTSPSSYVKFILYKYSTTSSSSGPDWSYEFSQQYSFTGSDPLEELSFIYNGILVTPSASRMFVKIPSRMISADPVIVNNNAFVFNAGSTSPDYSIILNPSNPTSIFMEIADFHLSEDGSTLVGVLAVPFNASGNPAVYFLGPTSATQGTGPWSSYHGKGPFAVSADGSRIALSSGIALFIYLRQGGGYSQIYQSPVFPSPSGISPFTGRKFASFTPSGKLVLTLDHDGIAQYGYINHNYVLTYSPLGATYTPRTVYYAQWPSDVVYNLPHFRVARSISVASDSSFAVGYIAKRNIGDIILFDDGGTSPRMEIEVPIQTAFGNIGMSSTNEMSFDGRRIAYSYVTLNGNSSDDEIFGFHLSMIPTNFTASDGLFPERVRLTWSSVSGSTGYDVFRNKVDDFLSAVQLNINPVTFLSFGDCSAVFASCVNSNQVSGTRAVPGVTYYYFVRARPGNNFFQPARDTGFLADSPPAPTNLVASRDHRLDVTLNWNYSGDSLDPFNVYRSVNNPVVNTTGPPYVSNHYGTSYVDTGLVGRSPLTKYYYKVSAWNVSQGPPSNLATGFAVGQPTGIP